MISEEAISSYYPFDKLNKSEIKKFLSKAILKEFGKNEIIYNEGEASENFYFILKGKALALSTSSEDQIPIEYIGKGVAFGLISLFTDEKHSVTTKAVEETSVLTVKKDDFKAFLNICPLLALDFSTILSKRVKKRSGTPKVIFESLSVVVFSCGSIEKTKFYVNSLSEKLTLDASKKTLIVKFIFEGDGICSCDALGDDSMLFSGDYSDEKLLESLNRDGLKVLLFKGRGDILVNIDSIHNVLSEKYHFVFYISDLKTAKDYTLTNSFIGMASECHFVVLPSEENTILANKIISKVNGFHGDSVDIRTILVSQKNSKTVDYRVSLKSRIYGELGDDDCNEIAIKHVYRYLSKNTLGVALGSGGAYGAAHIGVLKVLDTQKINLDMICGSSVGSIVASMWALGFSYKKMEESLKLFGRKLSVFSFWGISFPFKGLLRAKRSETVFKEIFGKLEFSDTVHSLRVVTFDFKRRKNHVIGSGLIYKAVAASCAMPGVFEPISVKGEILLDGGVLSPLPTQVLIRCGIKKVIAVNVTPHREDMHKVYQKKIKFNALDFVFGSIETMQQEFIKDSLEVADIVIHPHLEGLSWTDFNKLSEIINEGEKWANKEIDSIKMLIST